MKPKAKLSVISILILLAVCLVGSAAQCSVRIIHVRTNGSDSGSGMTWGSAKRTVQAGINATRASGDEVWVAAGTYMESVTLKPGIGLYGGFVGNETDRTQRNWCANVTILDANHHGSVLIISGNAFPNTYIDGFTIRNGQAGDGGGIFCGQFSPTIANNTITGNSATFTGGGISASNGATIVDNVVSGNVAAQGGGIYGAGTFTNNTIVNDSDGVWALSSSFVSNNIVAFNSIGISGSAQLQNNDVYGNTACNYSGLSAGVGDISVDPMFVDRQAANYHISDASLCINAGWNNAPGLPTVDVDGEARVQKGTVDIGADETNSDAPPPPSGSIVVRVSTDGSDSNDGSSWTKAKKTIQAAVQLTSGFLDGEVWVKAGSYNGSVTLLSHTYLYGGFAGTETDRTQRNWAVNKCTLTGGYSVIICPNGCLGGVDGFTIRNGNAQDGGGILCLGGSPGITNNIITANTANYGGGICCTSASPIISNNVIMGNGAFAGGAIFSDDGSNPTITNNTIISNYADGTGGIYCWGGSPATICNNIVSFNSGGIRDDGGALTVRNNDVYGNGGSDYVGLSVGAGDISADPTMASKEYGGYHVLSTSPCIDAGWNTAPGISATDIDGQARIVSGTVDIGADESNGCDPSANPPTIVRVSADGSDGNDGSSWAAAKKTIDSALQLVSGVGGEVWVKAGTYYERLSLPSFTYLYGGFAGTETARSQRNWSTWKSIVDGGKSGAAISLRGGCLCSAVDGFTIRNGKGGGVVCSDCSPNIANNLITGNSATYGGGVDCSSASPILSNDVITGNTASYGGGLYFQGSSATISECCITLNSASITGGGIYGYGVYTWSIASSIVSANSAVTYGGGMYFEQSTPKVTNNTVAGNNSSAGGAIYCDIYASPSVSNNVFAFNSSGIYSVGGTATPVLRNNDVYGNTTYNYSSVSAGLGDISADPLFVNRGAGEYHLTFASPCINAGLNTASGIPAIDMDGQARIGGASVDIGADEFWAAFKDSRLAPSGYPAKMTGVVVTAAFPDFFYVESDNRATGIRVNKAGHSLVAGMRAEVTGVLSTNSDSERCIDASDAHQSAAPNDSGSISPLAMRNGSLGGGPSGLQAGVGEWISSTDGQGQSEQIWAPANGANNIGLLVTTWGKFTKTGDTTFTIDDGSGVNVECIVPSGLTLDSSWKYVAVTGVSSCQLEGTELHRLLRVRAQDDITLMQ